MPDVIATYCFELDGSSAEHLLEELNTFLRASTQTFRLMTTESPDNSFQEFKVGRELHVTLLNEGGELLIVEPLTRAADLWCLANMPDLPTATAPHERPDWARLTEEKGWRMVSKLEFTHDDVCSYFQEHHEVPTVHNVEKFLEHLEHADHILKELVLDRVWRDYER